jgi:hypothetical protein
MNTASPSERSKHARPARRSDGRSVPRSVSRRTPATKPATSPPDQNRGAAMIAAIVATSQSLRDLAMYWFTAKRARTIMSPHQVTWLPDHQVARGCMTELTARAAMATSPRRVEPDSMATSLPVAIASRANPSHALSQKIRGTGESVPASASRNPVSARKRGTTWELCGWKAYAARRSNPRDSAR